MVFLTELSKRYSRSLPATDDLTFDSIPASKTTEISRSLKLSRRIAQSLIDEGLIEKSLLKRFKKHFGLE